MLALGTNRLPRPDMPLPVIAPFVVSATQRRAPQKSRQQVKQTPEGLEVVKE